MIPRTRSLTLRDVAGTNEKRREVILGVPEITLKMFRCPPKNEARHNMEVDFHQTPKMTSLLYSLGGRREQRVLETWSMNLQRDRSRAARKEFLLLSQVNESNLTLEKERATEREREICNYRCRLRRSRSFLRRLPLRSSIVISSAKNSGS